MLILSAATAGAQPAGGGKGGHGGGRGGMRPYADPSLIIAAELAFDRLAVEKGQWTALAEIVAKDAVLFRPGPVLAEKWLKGRRNPPLPLRWQTRRLLMACDGSVAISMGRWVRSGGGNDAGDSAGDSARRGWFTNIWRREKKGYRLILNDEGVLASAEAARGDDELEAMTAHIATCPRRARRGDGAAVPAPPPVGAVPLDPAQPLPTSRDDRADDGTLRWHWAATPDGGHILQTWIATESGEDPVDPDVMIGAMP